MPFKEPLLLTVPKKQGHGTPCRSTWRSPQVGQEAEGMKDKVWPEPYCGFLGKEWTRLANLSTFRIEQFK